MYTVVVKVEVAFACMLNYIFYQDFVNVNGTMYGLICVFMFNITLLRDDLTRPVIFFFTSGGINYGNVNCRSRCRLLDEQFETIGLKNSNND